MEKEATIEILKNITSKFEGYKNSKINDGKIIKIFDENFNNLKKTGTNDNYFVCFDKTPFFFWWRRPSTG
ncbi:hypothetical protein NPX79_03210 [Spiroplasma endosymbiont of Anurida maritima]|uniref:hypothetical protein n=1 Tax=Spiroplasma endosymbiont of Anurida maritima TaxID=2967972 RepID=UPI0036D40FB1